QHNRGKLLRESALVYAAHGLGPDEAGVLLAAPAEPGLDRTAGLHQVVAVEVEADLEPEGVAGAQPGGRDARLQEGVPDGGRMLGREQELDPVLARVARAAHEHARRRGDDQLRGPEAAGELAAGE